MSNEITFEITSGDDPREIARRISSIVVGNRDTWEKNPHCWFFGENNEWALLRITPTKFTLRSMDGITYKQHESLKTVVEWLLNPEIAVEIHKYTAEQIKEPCQI